MFEIEDYFYQFSDFLTAQISGADFSRYFFTLKLFSFVLSVLFLAGIITLLFRKIGLGKVPKLFSFSETPLPKKKKEWDIILARSNRADELAWKFAVIEADKLVDSVLKKMFIPGDTMGERMQNLKPGQFVSLDNLWHAHKVRNFLVHETGYSLTQKEAQAAIENFEVFLKESGVL